MSNPRNRDQLRQSKSASQPAALPSIPPVQSGDAQINRFCAAVKEWIEVRSGSRGNPFEVVLTKRDLIEAGLLNDYGVQQQGQQAGVLVRSVEGYYHPQSIDEVAEQIRNTQLYKDLLLAINDPRRFDRFQLPDELKQILLKDLLYEAAQRQADIQRIEKKLQTETQSLAYAVDRITASVSGASAAIQSTSFAATEANRATAGQVTTVTARLDNVDGAGATIEEAMIATDDRLTGAEAQYTLKVSTGGAIAGIGLASTTPVEGNATSAIILMADKLAIVDPSYSGGLDTTPDAASIPFVVSGGVVYIRQAFIKDGDIVSAKIGTAAITSAKIDALAVTTAKIDDLAVTTGKIANLAVDTLQIAGEAVTVPRYAYSSSSYSASSFSRTYSAGSVVVVWYGGGSTGSASSFVSVAYPGPASGTQSVIATLSFDEPGGYFEIYHSSSSSGYASAWTKIQFYGVDSGGTDTFTHDILVKQWTGVGSGAKITSVTRKLDVPANTATIGVRAVVYLLTASGSGTTYMEITAFPAALTILGCKK